MPRLAFAFAAALLVLPLAACGEAANRAEVSAEARREAADGLFTVEIVGQDGRALHYITGERRTAAMLTEDGTPDAARLLEGRAAERAYREALAALDVPEGEPQDVQLRLFGFSFAADKTQDGDGHVTMNMNLPGGRQFSLNAGDGAAGGGAHVVIDGSRPDEVADYIDDIHDAPRNLRIAMKESLGL